MLIKNLEIPPIQLIVLLILNLTVLQRRHVIESFLPCDSDYYHHQLGSVVGQNYNNKITTASSTYTHFSGALTHHHSRGTSVLIVGCSVCWSPGGWLFYTATPLQINYNSTSFPIGDASFDLIWFAIRARVAVVWQLFNKSARCAASRVPKWVELS